MFCRKLIARQILFSQKDRERVNNELLICVAAIYRGLALRRAKQKIKLAKALEMQKVRILKLINERQETQLDVSIPFIKLIWDCSQ